MLIVSNVLGDYCRTRHDSIKMVLNSFCLTSELIVRVMESFVTSYHWRPWEVMNYSRGGQGFSVGSSRGVERKATRLPGEYSGASSQT